MIEVARSAEERQTLSYLESRLLPLGMEFVETFFDHPFIVGEGGLSVLVGDQGGRWGAKMIKNLACPRMMDRVKQRTEREHQGLLYLQNKVPRIPRVQEAIRAAGTGDILGYILEILDGTPIIEANLSTAENIYLIIQLLDTLSFMHRLGAVHRDIKPRNLLVDKEPGILNLKLIDFNTLRAESIFPERITPAGRPVGTVKYMSPEAVNGENGDHRSDIFSVGAVLYELISGQNPMIAKYGKGEYTTTQMMNLIWDDRRDLPRIDGVDDWLLGIIDKSMKWDQTKRFQSALEMKTALEEYLRVKNLFPEQVIEVTQSRTRIGVLKQFTSHIISAFLGQDPTHSHNQLVDREIFQSLENDTEWVILKPLDIPLQSGHIDHQCEILTALSDLDSVPEVYEVHRYGNHSFGLKKQFFPLISTIGEWMNEYRSILKSLSDDEAEMILGSMFIKMLSELDKIHEHGVIHGNLNVDSIHFDCDFHGNGNFEKEKTKFNLKFDHFHAARWEKSVNSVAYPFPTENTYTLDDGCEDRRRDIYSVGVCLHAMLIAFYFSMQMETDELLRESSLENVYLRGASRELCEIIDKAKSADPNQRFETAREMESAIMDFLRSETLPVKVAAS